MRPTFRTLLLSLALAASPALADGSRGPGGGGALFSAAISPHDANLLYMSTDMSGVFRSPDFGRHWSLLDFRQLQGGHNSPVRFTANPKVVFSLHVTDELNYGRPVKSHDGGVSWRALESDPTHGEAWFLDTDPDSGGRLLLAAYDALYLSNDGGASFKQVHAAADLLVSGAFWAGERIFVGSSDGLLVSTDNGQSFHRDNAGIPAGEFIVSLTGARDGSGIRLFAATAGSAWPGIGAEDLLWNYRNLYRRDWGKGNWRRVDMGLGAGDAPYLLGMARNAPNTLYAAGGNRDNGRPIVFKTGNGGTDWTRIFHTGNNANIATGWCGDGGAVNWTWAEYPMSFAVAPNDARRALLTDFGFAHVTEDGGRSWRQAYVDPAYQNPAGAPTPAAKAYKGTGVEQTSSWWLHWVDADNLLAAYSDIRGGRSDDRGRSWTLGSTLGLPHNSTYQFVAQGGRLYGATATVHDLYQSTYLSDARIDPAGGAVVMSADGGRSWSILHDFGHPVVRLAAAPGQPNTLYAGVVHSGEGGIYVTHELNRGNAARWTRLATPPRTRGHPYNLQVLKDGTLVASYSGHIDASGAFTTGSGVFVSNDGGNSWQDRSHPGMRRWTKDLTIDPHDPEQNTWYAGVFSHWGSAPNEVGGVYRSRDRGRNWQRISELYRVESVAVHPRQPDTLFVATETQGLWVSVDGRTANPTFSPMSIYPFRHPLRVFFNPYRPGETWVSSFGGGLRVLPDWRRMPVRTTWQWQLDGDEIDLSVPAAMYDVDLFDVSADTVTAIRAKGAVPICYISMGSWENWRPDAGQFPPAVIGKAYDGWPGERWLDIRRIDLLAPILGARLDLCKTKGFQGVEPDNIDGYTNDSGFPLTAADQLAFNIWLAEQAHARGLSIGLKNDPQQAVDLLPWYDWAMTEDCFDQGWCKELGVFVAGGKPVFAAEYTDTGIATDDFCPQARALGFQAILKNRELDAWRDSCPADWVILPAARSSR